MSRASCALIGPGAALLARAALRRHARGAVVPLLVRIGGRRPRSIPGVRAKAARAMAAELAGQAPEGVEVLVDGGAVVVAVPASDTAAAWLQALVERHAGALAVAVEVPRDDAIDGLLRSVDEILAVEPIPEAVREPALRELATLGPVLTVAPPRGAPRRGGAAPARLAGEDGQSTVAVVAIIAGVVTVAAALALVASALGRDAGSQGRADVAALAGARALLDAQPEYFSADPRRRITSAEYRARATKAASRIAAANDLEVEEVELLGDRDLPTKVRVTVRGAEAGRAGRRLRSTAEVAVSAGAPELASGGGYSGPLAVRQGQRMRPDVALAFDRMAAAARGDGHALVIASAFRSDAEQAKLFAANPNPRWVAPPGKSLHRLGTELDLGPAGAYGWLAANATRFGFLQRYSWEPWHYGYTRSAGSTSVGYRASKAAVVSDDDGEEQKTTRAGGSNEASGSAIPSFVPTQYAPLIAKAAQRWSVGAALLGAQIQVESGFNPRAVSGAGAAGIAQFMPGTAAQYGLTPAERFDPAKAIDAQAHHMHDLLRQFASVPLALAAYNAGSGNVSKCMCVPPFPETQAYVQKILGLLGGAGLAAPGGLEVRLVA